jgi:hypothetical protein
MSIKNTESRITTKRCLIPVQSKGNLGKSTFSGFLLEWLQYAGIPFRAVDSDSAHQSLKNRYPDHTAKFDATVNQEAFGLLIDRIPDSPVVLWDFRANFTPDFLDYATHYRLIEVLDRKGFRPTLFIFMSNDEDARVSAVNLFSYFGDAADYIEVDNPKLFSSDGFRRTGLHKTLAERGSPIITMPEMNKPSTNCWEALEEKEGKYLSISQVIAHKACSDTAHFELSGVKDLLFRQFEDASKWLLPDVSLIKQKVTRVAETKPAERSRFNNPLFAKQP